MKFLSALPALGLFGSAMAAPAAEERSLKVPVKIAGGTVIGDSLLGVDHFNGIPFADPPVGQLRLKPPQKLSRDLGTFDARGIAPNCPQMFVSSESKDALFSLVGDVLKIPFLQDLTGQEDCLSISVQRPAGTKASDKLPVLFWMFGGGFEFGGASTYDATSLLASAMAQNQGFIFVSVNYRTGGFGFLPGAEILEDGSSNLGLLDQRMGLEWTADNIASFGGDPDKVTIWGESAGSISVFDQMALYGGDANYKGKPLFRGGIMNSGSIVPADPVDCPKGQAVYDAVVKSAGCDSSSDTLNCLRELYYNTYLNAANSVPSILSYNSVALSYLPRPDGKALPESPDVLASTGQYYAVPIIIGDQEDEGTIFSIFQSNITTTDKLVDYLSDLFFHSATKAELRELVDTYNPFITEGSPFRTTFFNELYPGYKRLAAILGDLTFTLSRRIFLDVVTQTNPDVPAWSYLSSYDHLTPIVGTFHASDILQVFYGLVPNHAGMSCRTYYFNFVHNLDPNKGVKKYDSWPEWKDSNDLMWFKTAYKNSILKDDFRSDSAQWIASHRDVLHI